MTEKPLEQQLEEAQHRLEAARIQASNLRERANSATPGGLNGYDTAILSGIRRKKNAKADAQRFAAYDREAAAWAAVPALEQAVVALQDQVLQVKA